jgi:hypothetical protein
MNTSIKTINLTVTVLVFLTCPITAYALNTGTEFMNISPDARSVGMGHISAGIADDVSATYWNPAGITQIKNNQFAFSSVEWLLGGSYQYVAYAENIHRAGTFGGNIIYLGYENLEGRTLDGIRTNDFNVSCMAVTLSYGNEITHFLGQKLSLGINVKHIEQNIEQETANGIAFDFGVLARFDMKNKLKLGLSVRNLGPAMKFVKEEFSLPLNYTLGASFQVHGMIVGADINYLPHENMYTLGLGMEYYPFTSSRHLSIRSGYIMKLLEQSTNNFDYHNDKLGTFYGLGAGIGIKMGKNRIDYAFVPYGDLGSMHRFTLLWVTAEPVLRKGIENITQTIARYTYAGTEFIFTKVLDLFKVFGKTTGLKESSIPSREIMNTPLTIQNETQ